MEIPTTEAINGLRFRYISMMKKTLTAWVLAALCLVSCGVDKNIRKGEKFLQLGEYYDARPSLRPHTSALRPRSATSADSCRPRWHIATTASTPPSVP